MRIYATLIALFFIVTASYSQDEASDSKPFSFGIKAGANYSSVNGTPSIFYNYRLGYHFGVVGQYQVIERLSVVSEITYSRQGFKSDPFEIRPAIDQAPFIVEFRENFDYLNVPVVADYVLAGGLSIYLGPQFGISIDSSREAIDVDPSEEEIIADFLGDSGLDLNTVEVGVVLGFKYLFESGIFLEPRYVIGVTEVFDGGNGNTNRNLQLSLGFMF